MSNAENAQAIAGLEVTESRDYHLLPVETRAQLALASTKTETDLKAMVAKHATITEIKDKAGREQAHGAAMELMRARTTIVNVAKAARDDATKFSKAVIAEEARLVAIVEPEETRLKALRDAWDDEQARIKREREEAERKRLLAIGERITEIKGFATMAMQCRTSERVQSLIDKLTALPIEGFDEFETDAALAKSIALDAMGNTLRGKQADEAEAKRLADERAAQERVRLEQEERQRQLDAQAAEVNRQQLELQRSIASLGAAVAPKPVEEAPAAQAEAPVIPVVPPSTAVVPPQEIAAQPDALAEPAGSTLNPAAAWPFPKRTPAPVEPPKPTRPTDEVIIGALALHFRVHEAVVVAWLQEMDMEAAGARLAAEFA